jgi:zinc/manganese transport system permease protein
MTVGWFDWPILLPALLAGLLVLATHVPLGTQVLERGIVFIDLAIAQIAGIGVIAADALGLEPQGWAVQVSALAAALLGALILTWTERRWPDIQEALIGVSFVLASCAGLLLLAGNPHGGEHLKDLLVGQILWVSSTQLAGMAVLSALVLVLWFGLRERLGRMGFYLLFALAVTASVQLVCVRPCGCLPPMRWARWATHLGSRCRRASTCHPARWWSWRWRRWRPWYRSCWRRGRSDLRVGGRELR